MAISQQCHPGYPSNISLRGNAEKGFTASQDAKNELDPARHLEALGTQPLERRSGVDLS
jgi:hypothetical protein